VCVPSRRRHCRTQAHAPHGEGGVVPLSLSPWRPLEVSTLRWCQDNRNRSNQESKFDFLATRQQLGKIDGGQQKIKIIRTNWQSNLRGSCQSIFSLCRHHPMSTQLFPSSLQKFQISRVHSAVDTASVGLEGALWEWRRALTMECPQVSLKDLTTAALAESGELSDVRHLDISKQEVNLLLLFSLPQEMPVSSWLLMHLQLASTNGIPADLALMTNLEQLSLATNELTELPDTLCPFPPPPQRTTKNDKSQQQSKQRSFV